MFQHNFFQNNYCIIIEMDQQSNPSGPAMAIQKHFLLKGKMDTCSQWGPALKGILCCERSIPVRSIEEGEGLCVHERGNQIGCKFKWHQTTLGTYHRLAPDIIFLYCDNHMQELNPLQIVFKSGRIGISWCFAAINCCPVLLGSTVIEDGSL